jgi:hypothetical protein
MSNQLIQAGLHEISAVPIRLIHCAASGKDLVVPADIKTIAENIHLISNCAEVKAERWVEIL